MFNPIAVVFFILFGVMSVAHLVLCFLELEKARKITKPFCLLLLLVAAIIQAPKLYLIYIGLILCLLGDIFLIENKQPKRFLGGCLSFLFGHICFLLQIMMFFGFDVLPWWFYLVIGLVYVGAMIGNHFITVKMIPDYPRYINFYAAILLVMLVSSCMVTIMYPQFIKATIFLILGYAIFISSDLTLELATFVKDFKRRDFYIMITYLVGTVFITLGLLMLPLI